MGTGRNADGGTREEEETGAPRAQGGAEGPRVSGTVRRLGTRAPPRRLPNIPCKDIDDVIRAYRVHVREIAARAGMKEDTADVVQEVFVNVDLHLRRTSNRMPDDLPGMLVKITWDKIVDQVRARARERGRRGKLEAEAVPPSQPNPEETVRLQELAGAILGEMPPEDAATLLQYAHVDADNVKETAERLGISAGGLRSRVSRARAMFAAVARRLRGDDPGDDSSGEGEGS